MESKKDDLEAVRILVSTLEPFDKVEQERIMRWAREKLGLSPASTSSGSAKETREHSGRSAEGRDIKSFVSEKAPTSDTHFAATVAYYYQFEAPEILRKVAITGEDIQDATRKTGRSRLSNPGQTLINAHRDGLLDKAGERGAYALNTVGENLVAMTLPLGTAEARPARKKRIQITGKKLKKKTETKTKH